MHTLKPQARPRAESHSRHRDSLQQVQCISRGEGTRSCVQGNKWPRPPHTIAKQQV